MLRATRIALLCAAAPSLLAAQGATLSGTVHNAQGAPIPLVSIVGRDLRVSAQTDTLGRFTLRDLNPGPATFVVRRIGFEPGEFAVALTAGVTLTLDVTLHESAVPLPAMLTVDESRVRRMLAGFYRRKESGAGGHFIQRADIEKRGALQLSDMMRTIGGVDIRRAEGGRSVTRMTRSANPGGRDCPPDMWVDGARAPGLNLDDILARDVEAMEVYKGMATIPPEFRAKSTSPTCGAIAIWTRVPGT